MGLRSGLCADQSSSSTPIDKPFLHGHCFMHGDIVMLKQERAFPNCCHKVKSTESSRMSLYAAAIWFPFTGTKARSPNYEKQAPDHYSSSTKLYSWLYVFGQVAFTWHPPNQDLSIRRWNVTHHSWNSQFTHLKECLHTVLLYIHSVTVATLCL